MKTFLAALIIIFVGMAASYAGGLLMLKVGSADSGGVIPSTCGTGIIDASAGCPLPMLGM